MGVQITCVKCGTTFEREAKRGRPIIKCDSCRFPSKPRGRPRKVIVEPEVPEDIKKLRDMPKGNVNDKYSRAIMIDILESGEYDALIERHMADGASRAIAINRIIKSIGG